MKAHGTGQPLLEGLEGHVVSLNEYRLGLERPRLKFQLQVLSSQLLLSVKTVREVRRLGETGTWQALSRG